jgi:hypothetical protein
MTSSTSPTTDISALGGQTELFDLDAELIGLTADETAAETVAAAGQADAVVVAAAAERAARKEQRATTAAWIALFAGLVISLGAFASIAWHDSVASNGPSTARTTTAP